MPDPPKRFDPEVVATAFFTIMDDFFRAPSRESWRKLRGIVDAMKPPPAPGEDAPAPYDERYDIRQADVEKKLYDLGRMIGDDMPEGWGFALFLFSYGDGGATFYMSSAQRADVISMLKEYIAREERKA